MLTAPPNCRNRGRRDELGLGLGSCAGGVVLGDSLNDFAYRGFSLHPDGKSFLTSVRMKTQIYLLENLDTPVRLIDRLFAR